MHTTASITHYQPKQPSNNTCIQQSINYMHKTSTIKKAFHATYWVLAKQPKNLLPKQQTSTQSMINIHPQTTRFNPTRNRWAKIVTKLRGATVSAARLMGFFKWAFMVCWARPLSSGLKARPMVDDCTCRARVWAEFDPIRVNLVNKSGPCDSFFGLQLSKYHQISIVCGE